MPDEITRLSAEVARNPSGRSSIALAEALRRARRLTAAATAAERALSRHPYDADAHDVLARIAADAGDDQRARDEWEMAVQLDASHLPSHLGLAFLAYRQSDLAEAARRLGVARALAPNDAGVSRATSLLAQFAQAPATPCTADSAPNDIATPSAQLPLSPRTLFDAIKSDGALGVLLVDADGHVVAGAACDAEQHDVSTDLGAELCGLGEESGRALAQLGLGTWESLTVECGATVLSIAPAADETIVLVETDSATPIGMAKVLLARASRRAATWLEAL